MTWTKTGSEFSANCAAVDLSDPAYRTHHEVISWLYENEVMGCRIAKHRARKVVESPHAESAFRELVAVGFWKESETHYEVMHHGDVIRASLVAQGKKKDRDKRAAQTYRKNHSVSADVSADVSDDADRQTDKQVEDDVLQGCEHDSWGCLPCKRKAKESA